MGEFIPPIYLEQVFEQVRRRIELGLPPCEPLTRRERMREWIDERRWRVGAAWNLLLHGSDEDWD